MNTEEKVSHALWRNSVSQFFFRQVFGSENFWQLKVFGMVNYIGRLLVLVGKPLEQWVTRKSSSTFINAVSRLPNFKMFLQKNHYVQQKSGPFFSAKPLSLFCVSVKNENVSSTKKLKRNPSYARRYRH